MSTDQLRIVTPPADGGRISDTDLVDEVDASASRITTLMSSLWALSCDGGEIDHEHIGHLTDLAKDEAERIKKLANAWYNQERRGNA